LLQNFKKMIKWEQEEIKKCQEDIVESRRISDQYIEVFEEKVQNHVLLVDQIRRSIQNKQRLDDMFNRSDNIIGQSAIEMAEKLKQDANGQGYKRQ